jgi:competence protein ComEC
MLVLNSMLFFLKRNKYTRLLRSILLLLGIWFYALLTGLAPSVLRASAMFSFVIIGMNMNRRADIYNSLTASAFFLLLYNPFLILEVGFQLSYTAVIAIVSMQPRLYQLWRPRYWLPDKIWAIVTVSIAAQLGTAPLGLYYFHQFPNYFIVTNLLVIPLATLILYSGFLTVILSPIPLLGGWMSEILVYLLKTMNFSVAFIDGLPYSATTGVFISMLEMFILFLIIMAGFRALTLRRVFLLKTSLFLLLLYLGVGLFNGLQHMSRQRLVVYALQNDMAIDFINGRNSIMLIDSARLADPSTLEFQVAGHHVRCGIKQQKLLAFNELVRNNKHDAAKAALKIHYPFAFFNGQVILFLDHNFSVLSAVEDKLKVDLLILNHNHRNPADVFDNLDASCVVIGNNIPPWIALNWAETCAELDVPCHVVRKDGAFVMDL